MDYTDYEFNHVYLQIFIVVRPVDKGGGVRGGLPWARDFHKGPIRKEKKKRK